MNVEWPSGELAVAVSASLWAQRLMAEPDHHAGLVRRRWRLERAPDGLGLCVCRVLGRLLRAAHDFPKIGKKRVPAWHSYQPTPHGTHSVTCGKCVGEVA